MTTAADLYSLQETDLAIDKAEKRLSEIEEGLQEPEELTAARAVRDEKKAAVDALKDRQKELEWSVDETRTKSAEVEARLYGGKVTNPKELADLDADVKSIKNETRRREDILLGLLVEIDDAESVLSAAQGEYGGLEQTWRAGCADLIAEKEQIEPELERLRALREDQLETVDRAPLNLYQTLRERREGRAVSKVERGMCQGCRITLPMSVLQRARTGIGMIQCVSCERILLVT